MRLLCEHDVPTLLQQALPSEWKTANTVSWYPDDSNHNHPPKDWIKIVWRYLQEHFTTTEEILSLGKLPLIPLSMVQTPVSLTQLCHPSRVVAKRLKDDYLDDRLADVLKKLGLIVMKDYPTFIRHHPAVLGTFVNPPSAQGVLKAMVVSSNQMGAGRFSEVVRKLLSTNEKRLLRSFLSNVRPFYIGPAEYKVLCSLPVFETLSKKFVSKEEGLCAAPDVTLPVSLLQELIDITQQDSRTLALHLDVKILKPTELLCQKVFPDIQLGRYSAGQIDKLMTYVLNHHASDIRTEATFKQHLESLSFVPKQKGRARASDLFDPSDGFLRTIFANENVFPAAAYGKRSVLDMLEELGMKSQRNITAHDLYQSAKLVSRLSHLPTAEQKSKAILQFLSDNSKKLMEPVNVKPLGVLLKDIPWVVRLQERPPNYPPGLAWWGTDEEEGNSFLKPTEVKGHHFASLIGTVMPVVEIETSNQISKYFGWQTQPDVFRVVRHLRTLIQSYSKEEKPFYMFVVNKIYLFLIHAKYDDVDRVFAWFEEFDWVWNGDGFSSPKNVLFSKPHIDLAPYVRSLPSDMIEYSDLFYRFGMRGRIDADVLVQVLTLMKEKYDDESTPFSVLEVKHDLQLSVNVLNELANKQLPEELQAQIVFPTHIEDDSYVRLEPAGRCMYCDREWLKGEGDNENTKSFYLHPNVPNSTAERLGVSTLTSQMLHLDELTIGEEFGQEERLTIRINRLLEEYTDGFSVLKELVQNADDAGATEVRFLYDERTNEDAMTSLFDEGMKGYQGPALWVYNDAEFKDEDFKNITKLNEATKKHDTEKIGRFGLGFNAVYNLTDVPMFLSRNFFVIFDPHKSYLGKVKRRPTPGVKIDLNKDVRNLRKFADQFKPFNGIFGCDLHLDKEDNSLNGTLFRFPLRTREQAIESEIKNLCYDDHEVRELLQMLFKRANSLLLFTQNIYRVGVYRLPKQSSQPALLFEVVKSMSQVGILRKLHFPVTLPVTAKKLNARQQSFLKQCNFLQASSKTARNARYHTVDATELPQCSITVDIDCGFTKQGLAFFDVDERRGQERFTWLVVSTMGSGEAIKFAKNDESLLPSGGAAVRLVPAGNNKLSPLPVVVNEENPSSNGVIFCYLPLPIHSGLPVHINGALAVAANRRHLQVKLEDDKKCHGLDWNNVLMRDPILSAYLSLLEDVKSLAPGDGSYKFHSLWPKAGEVNRDCWPILESFYTKLAGAHHALFSDGEVWSDICQVVFLDPDFRMERKIGDTAFAVFKSLANEDKVVIDLPADVFQSFIDCGQWEAIQGRTYDKGRFFHELFFPNILKVRPDLRDVLVLNVVDDNSRDFNELLKTHPCIPASPRGETLKCPGQLINPNRKASSLFLPDDGRFPAGTEETFLSPQRLTKFEQLGMLSDDLPWKEIAERAESISRINVANSKAAVERVKALLSFMETKMKGKGKSPTDPVRTRILNAKFLPVLRKPKSFPLPWKGDEFQGRSKFLVAPKDVFLKEKKYLVCCTEPLVDLDISTKLKDLLNLRNKDVTIQHVLHQIDGAISSNIHLLDPKSYDEVNHICTEVYSCLQGMMTNFSIEIKERLLEKKFILVGKRFLSGDQVALELNADCSPYLFKLPESLADSYSRIMKLAGVREQFEEKDYISSLRQVQLQFRDRQLDDQSLEVTVNMAIQLGERLEQANSDSSKVQDKWGFIYLPTSSKVMRPVSQLCIKDCPWMDDDDDDDVTSAQFANENIPWPTCTRLGVKTRREKGIEDHDSGIPYGQREKLTTRLKHILEGYPCEKDILKELLQNADDAQATKICFIKDPRTHPDEKLPDPSWKPLQGPGLCVYNNKPFTNADIEGIQSLGEGSKGNDLSKTGQYGVGFNAVYHLTDVPSFMSRGEEIGDVLCVFDPHCNYVPKATDLNPGRRYKNINEMKRKFPDVFHCYLENRFSVENATMFRFPLRSEEMAEISKISPVVVTEKKLDKMMDGLKKELFEVLLFVNNVKKITVCAIDPNDEPNGYSDTDEPTGGLTDVYSVEVFLSQEDDRKRQAFADYIKEIGNQAEQNDNFLPTSIKVQKCIYSMTLRDTFGRQEKWLIVQQVGFEKSVETSIHDAFKKQQLRMLPRGGVACLLESTGPKEKQEAKKKAFCFLPLPFETDLPVHINGHFALDHEARRNLWRDEVGGHRTDWNNALLRDVIASCYLTILEEVRSFLKLPTAHERVESSLNCRSMIVQKLTAYEELFPRYPIQDPHWKTLANSVYQEMSQKRIRLIPKLRNVKEFSSRRREESHSFERVQITWFPPTGTGKEKIYFNDLEWKGCFASKPQRSLPQSKDEENKRKRREENRVRRKRKFEETLLETGFNLVAFSLTTFESFREAGVEVACVSPSAVMDFYKSFSLPDPLCNIGTIPSPVHTTPFKNCQGVIRVLKYCEDDDHFLKNLSGLPLLLSQDDYLSAFSESNRKCLSRYQDLLPRSPSIFVHKEVRGDIFGSTDYLEAPVFRPLDVEFFASFLNETLPQKYFSEGHYVKWCPDTQPATLPDQLWIYRFWSYLEDFAKDTMKKAKISEECREVFIRELLSPLSKWSLLPATKTIQVGKSSKCSSEIGGNKQTVVDHFLVRLDVAESVLDFLDCGTSDLKLVNVLRSLGLPEVDDVTLTTVNLRTISYTAKKDAYHFVRNLVASLKTPKSVLKALKWILETDSLCLDGKLRPQDATTVLEYFSRNVQGLTDVDKGTLRKLPFYPTTRGGLSKLDDSEPSIIPDELPKEGMDVVESSLGCLFLKPRQSLSPLYEFLDVEDVSLVDAYFKFVFKCFQHLSHEGKLIHFKYIDHFTTSSKVSQKDAKEIEKRKLLDYLKMVQFIPTKNGTMATASSFCDPRNAVFNVMLSEDRFPPKPFDSEEWLGFLEMIGLIQDVSQDDFQRFAKQVALEAAVMRTEDTYKRSRVLVHYLFSQDDLLSDDFLKVVRDIPFVASDPVNEDLRALYPQFGETKDGKIAFIAFNGAVSVDHTEIVWTEAHLLPRWADPKNHQSQVDCPTSDNCGEYCSDVHSHLQIHDVPSVDMVAAHCQKLCFHLGIEEKEKMITDKNRSTILAVMYHIYSFLERNVQTIFAAKERLAETPCILVDDGRKFIWPKQAVLELYDDTQIEPFLYRVPPQFGLFQTLFELLGCSRVVTASHYAMVLKMLHEECHGLGLSPSDRGKCFKAVKGFFKGLQERKENISSLSEFYLPAESLKKSSSGGRTRATHVALCKSEMLIFDDAPNFRNRIQNLDQLFVVDLGSIGVSCKSVKTNFKDLVMKLPTALQPRMLSSVVNEKFSSPHDLITVKSAPCSLLSQQLSSAQFGRGLVRLICHENCEKDDFDEGTIAVIERGLRKTEIIAIQNLTTTLFCNGDPILESEAGVSHLLNRVVTADDNHTYRLYVNTGTVMDDITSIISLASKVVVNICGGHIRETAYLIPGMLQCSPGRIKSFLDSMDIRPDGSCGDAMDAYPDPGTFIPIENHHLLNDAFEVCEPDDCVGYELSDPNLQMEDGCATYIYAVIVEELTDESAPVFTKRYKINIGHDEEPKDVDAVDVYKFHSLQAICSSAILTEEERQLPRETKVREKFSEISKQLKEAWKDPEVSKQKVCKRLKMQWHPDKNLGDEDFCKDVLQLLQNEIERLERECPLDTNTLKFNDDSYRTSLDARAREHRLQRQRYRETVPVEHDRDDSPSDISSEYIFPPTFTSANPQPTEARRWLKQAEADVKAAEKDLTSDGSYEWACFKCHQVNRVYFITSTCYIFPDYKRCHVLVVVINRDCKPLPCPSG